MELGCLNRSLFAFTSHQRKISRQIWLIRVCRTECREVTGMAEHWYILEMSGVFEGAFVRDMSKIGLSFELVFFVRTIGRAVGRLDLSDLDFRTGTTAGSLCVGRDYPRPLSLHLHHRYRNMLLPIKLQGLAFEWNNLNIYWIKNMDNLLWTFFRSYLEISENKR